ncbi:hypothetical protein WT05_19945 [Burkholderia stagnalis]|nr:hypothetical protein WT05_19945 [Burkholderia stagnalis]
MLHDRIDCQILALSITVLPGFGVIQQRAPDYRFSVDNPTILVTEKRESREVANISEYSVKILDTLAAAHLQHRFHYFIAVMKIIICTKAVRLHDHLAPLQQLLSIFTKYQRRLIAGI